MKWTPRKSSWTSSGLAQWIVGDVFQRNFASLTSGVPYFAPDLGRRAAQELEECHGHGRLLRLGDSENATAHNSTTTTTTTTTTAAAAATTTTTNTTTTTTNNNNNTIPDRLGVVQLRELHPVPGERAGRRLPEDVAEHGRGEPIEHTIYAYIYIYMYIYMYVYMYTYMYMYMYMYCRCYYYQHYYHGHYYS